jgi:hypothetical protein
MWLQRVELRPQYVNNFLARISTRFCWVKSMKSDYLPFSEWRNICSSATYSIIKIKGTNDNSIKFLITVKRLLRRDYVIDAGHDAK